MSGAAVAAETRADSEFVVRVIAAEARRRRHMADPSLPDPSVPQAMPRLPPGWIDRRRYALTELLAFPDRHFIDAAYVAIIGRLADPTGGGHFLSMLRQGEMTKTEIVAHLRASPEAERRAVVIDGLAPRRSGRLGRLPLVGPLLRWLFALRAVPDQLRSIQREQALREENTLQLHELCAEMAFMRHEIAMLRARLDAAGSD